MDGARLCSRLGRRAPRCRHPRRLPPGQARAAHSLWATGWDQVGTGPSPCRLSDARTWGRGLHTGPAGVWGGRGALVAPGHGLSTRSPSRLPGSWLCSSQTSPVPHAWSLPPSRGRPQAQDAGVCVWGTAGPLVGKAASSDPLGRGRLPALAHARLSRADAPRVCSEKSCVTPACHSWASRPVKGSPRGFWEWPTQRGGHRAERAGGLAPAPAHRTGGKAFAPRAAERLATAQLALEGMGRDGGRRLVLSVTSSLRSASWGAEGPCPVSMSEGT